MDSKVGDIVSWRPKPRPGGRVVPMGLAGCEVLELGKTADGQPAARLRAFDEDICVLVADLERP